MRFEAKEIVLKNGTVCLLRSPEPEDAEAMLSLLRTTAGETDFLIRYPEETTYTDEEEREILNNMQSEPGTILIGAFTGNEIMGTCGVNPVGSRQKVRHRCVLGIGILRRFWNLGLGRALFLESERFAKEFGYEQIELGVYSKNTRAIALYRSLGYQICGELPRAVKYKSGAYDSELTMYKCLDASTKD